LRQKVTQIKTENHHDKRELKEKDQKKKDKHNENKEAYIYDFIFS